MTFTLSGFMGCGKSTVGKMLIERLPQYELIDLDTFIEESQGRDIPGIFATSGEAAFRLMEARALSTIFALHKDSELIVSLGGGTLMTSRCAALVTGNSTNIYLRGSEDFLVANLLRYGTQGRPMLDGAGDETELRAMVHRLLTIREDTYLSCARHVVTLDGKSYEAIADETAALISSGKVTPSSRG